MRVLLAARPDLPADLSDHPAGGLTERGVILDRTQNPEEIASTVALSGPFDLVLLSTGKNVADELATLRSLRRGGMSIPVIVLPGSRPTPEAEEAALHAGADAVVFQPLRVSVLHARMQALARRARGYACPELRCGNVLLEQDLHQVSVDGRRVALTAREFDVLETLMLHKGVLLTKERFMTTLYTDGAAPDSKIVDVFVCKLRRKLAAAGAAEMIRTVWGRGYLVFEPSTSAVDDARAARKPEASIEPAPRGWIRRGEREDAVRAQSADAETKASLPLVH